MDERLLSTKDLLREIISRLGLREVPNLPLYDMFVWMGHALRHIGGYTSLETTTKEVTINNYTGKWPEDMHAIIRVEGHPQFVSKRAGFVIDLKEGKVTIEYDRYPLDEEGYPLFPNNPSTIDAVIWFVAWYLSIQDKLPNKNLRPDYCESQWQWYCGQARAEGFAPSIDQWERMVNIFYRMIPMNNEYPNEFTGLSERESLSRSSINRYNH